MNITQTAGDEHTQPLSPRELEILRRLPSGGTYDAIARGLGISRHTVDTYIRRIRAKVGAANRTQLVVLALRLEESHSTVRGLQDA
ncbi:helix-turn-helix transcriptional regulator [Streptomyces sp. NPDC046870]|uniref:response regulator transcription factor n=1 Tax=Streptomyces sp. NPDC046870 TaxID=3155135 RepID=UPI00345667DC